MPVSVQQILADVKKLAGRLKDHDSSADLILSQAQAMYRQIDTMKEYQEELMELNTAAHHRPHLDLIANIQQENRQLRALESENKELKSALEEHQNTLEFIMSKYRQQVSRLLEAVQVEKKAASLSRESSTKLICQADKISDMMVVMHKAAQVDDEFVCKEAELFSKLMKENQGLKELLDIGSRNGSIGNTGLNRVICEDKEVQTSIPAEETESS